MSRTRMSLLTALALLTGTSGAALIAGPAGASTAAAPCTVDYKVQNQWDTGFTAAVTITNNGAAKSSWSLKWSYAGNQKISNGWNAKVSQSGTSVTAANESYNGTLGTGGSASFGFQASYSGTNAIPATFTLDGVTCNVDGGGPTDPGPTDPGPTDPGPTDPGPGGSKAANPYVGAKVYVNPEWSAKAAAEPGGSRISNQPTAVWLDRIAAINGVNGGMGLRAHLDEALKQKGSGELVVQLVIYDLPGRDCAA
ncbi:MAG: cellulose 1,4-beta-cellobiosidase, partial [Streptomyces sp.]|nr:cellulose 1,4-beta-cellobiosidase [Streptomyces sp.]